MMKLTTDNRYTVSVDDREEGARLLHVEGRRGVCIGVELASHESQAVSQALMPHPEATGETSDGSHTFNELYDHRRALTAALMCQSLWPVWRSRNHHPTDDPCFPGYFIVGIDLPTGRITYHYEDQYWEDFRAVPEIAHSPKWDGAPPSATVTRLLEAARG